MDAEKIVNLARKWENVGEKTLCRVEGVNHGRVSSRSLRGDIDLDQESRPYLVRQPENMRAVAGETVRMTCLVANMAESDKCQWTRNGFGLGQELELPGYERYRMEDSQTGECSLLISPVLLTDEAVYQCQVGTVRSSNIKLVVNSPASQP